MVLLSTHNICFGWELKIFFDANVGRERGGGVQIASPLSVCPVLYVPSLIFISGNVVHMQEKMPAGDVSTGLAWAYLLNYLAIQLAGMRYLQDISP